MLEHVADGILLLDRLGVVRLWNPAAEAITFIAAADVVGHAAADAIPGWKTAVERVPVSASPDPGHDEVLIPIETSRGERWIAISGVRFFGGTVYAFRDLTDARRLEEIKADFIATASHELRTPLAAVYGAAQTLLRHDFALDETGRERFVSLIADESERLGRIVNEILLANQLDAGRLDLESEPFDAGDLVERVVEATRMHAPPSVTLEVEAPESVPQVAADADKVRQVLVNLVENGIKYSPDGGRVEVGIEEHDGFLRFRVRDEGLGVAPRGPGADLREVLPRRPADDARRGRDRSRALHLRGADRPHGRPHLGRAQRGQGLHVRVRAADRRGDGARAATAPAATIGSVTYGGDLVSTWSVLRQSCKRRSPVGLLKQPGHNASAKNTNALALAA